MIARTWRGATRAGDEQAYADYLEEQGDPRGELIQVQLALEEDNKSAAERERLWLRELQLLRAHEREWLGELAPLLLDQKISEHTREEAVSRALELSNIREDSTNWNDRVRPDHTAKRQAAPELLRVRSPSTLAVCCRIATFITLGRKPH